jgi:hypothetical protein
MAHILATLWIYRRCAGRTVDLLRRNWVVGLSLLVYTVVLAAARVVAAPLHVVGGLLLALLSSACISSFLHLIEQILRSGRADLDDFRRGFGIYFWEVVRISFLFWIAGTLLRVATAGQPNAGLLQLCVTVVAYILFNAVPELIYQSHHSGLELITASYRFIVTNWIEWFVPNVAAGVAVFFLLRGVARVGLGGAAGLVMETAVLGLALVCLMVFRGLLFAELHSSTGRSRRFRYRAR